MTKLLAPKEKKVPMCMAKRGRRGVVRGGVLEEVAKTDKRRGSVPGGQGKSSEVQGHAKQDHSLMENDSRLLWRLESIQPYGIVAGGTAWGLL